MGEKKLPATTTLLPTLLIYSLKLARYISTKRDSNVDKRLFDLKRPYPPMQRRFEESNIIVKVLTLAVSYVA